MALKKMYDEDEDKKPSPFKKIPLYDAGGEAGGGQAATGAQASGSGETASEGSATDAIASLGAGTGDNQSGETTKPENWATKQIHAMGKSKSPAYFANVPTGNTYHAPDWHVNLYDHGGEVNTNNAMPADRGAKIFVMGRADGGNGSRVNLYDEGGEATVQGIGGQAIPADATLPPDHQMAVIEDGERVLTPAETAAYDVEHPQEAAMHASPTETLNWEPERGFKKAMPNEGIMAGANIKPLPGQVNIPAPVAEANTDNTINMLDKAPKVPTHPPTTPTKINLGGEEYNAQLSEDAAKNTGKFIKGEPIENAPDPTGAMKEIFQQQKEKAAMSGNLLDMGKALIAEKQFTKADMPQYGGPGLVSGRTGEAVTPDDSKIKQVGKENYGDKIAMYKKAYQSALDEFTPEGQKRAAGIKEAMLNYEKEHPYGAQESAHPGIGGKILHGLSQVGQIAGEALGEGPVLAQIPGTQLNRKAEENRALGMGKEASAEELQSAEAAQKTAAAKQATQMGGLAAKLLPKGYALKQDANGNYELEQVPGFRDAPKNTQEALARRVQDVLDQGGDPNKDQQVQQLMDVISSTQKAPATSAEQHKEDLERIAKTAALGGHPLDDPATFKPNLAAALADGTITQDQAAAMSGYNTLNKTPVTQVTLTNENADTAQKRKDDNKYYMYKTADDNGNVKWDLAKGKDIPDDAQNREEIKNPEALANEGHAMNAVVKSTNQLAQDVYAHPEIWENAVARNLLLAATKDMDVQVGALVGGTGGSVKIPESFTKAITTALQNNALDKATGKALKDYIADYKAVKDKGMTIQMDLQNGKAGRAGAQMVDLINNQFPNGETPDAETARRQIQNFNGMTGELLTKFPDEYGTYTKEKIWQPPKEATAGGGGGNNPFPRTKGAPAGGTKPSAGQGGTAPKNPFRHQP